jgi:hypothetical protein
VLPAISDDQVSDDLVWLTEELHKRGAPISAGFLGGEFGYGADFENETFMMHPYCWCEREDCPWCWGCICSDDADIYEVRGERVEFDEWAAEYDRTGNRDRSYRKDPNLACDYCRGERESAPNFLHKPSGSRIAWYKYIGRDMEVELNADWRAILADCVESLSEATSATMRR